MATLGLFLSQQPRRQELVWMLRPSWGARVCGQPWVLSTTNHHADVTLAELRVRFSKPKRKALSWVNWQPHAVGNPDLKTKQNNKTKQKKKTQDKTKQNKKQQKSIRKWPCYTGLEHSNLRNVTEGPSAGSSQMCRFGELLSETRWKQLYGSKARCPPLPCLFF